MMRDHLATTSPAKMGQDWNKAMHLAVEIQFTGDFAADRFERTTQVVDWEFGGARDEPIGDPGRQASTQEKVLPLFSPTMDQVVTLVDRVEHHRNIGRIVLQISIQGYQDFTLGMIDTCLHRRRLPKIAAQDHGFDAAVAAGQFLDNAP